MHFFLTGPTVSNSLPDHLLRGPAVDSKQLRWELKTYLFAGYSKHSSIEGVYYITVLYKSTFTYLLITCMAIKITASVSVKHENFH